MIIIGASSRSIFFCAPNGTVERALNTSPKATDIAVASDGTIYVADQSAGGVMVLEADGAVRARLGRAGESADSFKQLARVVVDASDVVYALDSAQLQIHRFDPQHRRAGIWSLEPIAEDASVVDMAWHPKGLVVLWSTGQAQQFSASGEVVATWETLAGNGVVEKRAPTGFAIDRSGMAVMCFPRDGILARYQGERVSIRGAKWWDHDLIAADGRGHLVTFEATSGDLRVFDASGWLVQRFGGYERKGGVLNRPSAMALSHDGKVLAILDKSKYAVYCFNMDAPQTKPLVFGQKGRNAGQFRDPIALCVDINGDIFVTDEDQHRIHQFDKTGAFKKSFGSYDRGREPSEVVEPALIAAAPDGRTVYVYDADHYEIQKFVDGEYIGSAGGRGRELGQLSRPVAMACDREGLLYVVDSSRYDMQVMDFRGNNAVTLVAVPTKELGISSPSGLALNPDGMPWIASDGRVVGLNWK